MIPLLITYALNIFDLVMTNHWVSKYGIEIEGNPIGRFLYETGLVYPVKIVGVGLLLLLLHFAVKYRDKGTESTTQWWDLAKWVVLTAYSLLAVYHVVLIIAMAGI